MSFYHLFPFASWFMISTTWLIPAVSGHRNYDVHPTKDTKHQFVCDDGMVRHVLFALHII